MGVFTVDDAVVVGATLGVKSALVCSSVVVARLVARSP